MPMRLEKITKVSIYTSIMCISSYISFPLPFSPTPITLQTAVMNMMALILKPIEVLCGMILYVLLGILGLPVFAGGISGPDRIMGPTGGYIIGMLFAACLISILKGKKANIKKYILITVCIGMPVIYICGMISMSVYLHQDIKAILWVSILPYLPGDLLKCVAGAYFGVELNRRRKSI